MSDSKKTGWEDLLMGAFEKISTAREKFKDPKESVGAAVDWVKSFRDDIQERVFQEVSSKLASIDWENLSKKVGEHLADHYDLEIKVAFKPKNKSPKNPSKEHKAEHGSIKKGS